MGMAESDRARHATSTGDPLQGVRRLLDLRMYSQALGQCRFLLQSDPDSAELHQLAGVAALEMRELQTAELHLDTAQTNDPEDADTFYFLARLWQERGFPRRAEENVQRALVLNPYAAEYWGQWSWISYRERKFKEAREHASKACELRADDPRFANLLALAEAECEDGTKYAPELQVQRLRELLALDPEQSALHHNLGLVYYHELGDYAQASRHFAAAVELDPTENDSRHLLERSLRRQDRFLKWVHLPTHLLPQWKRLRAVAHRCPAWWFLLVPLGVTILVPTLVLLALWAVWMWPIGKGYEYLTIAELRRETSAFGPAGLLRVHRWPFAVRLVVFVSLLLGFWIALMAFWHVKAVKMVFGLLLGLVLVEWSGLSVRDALREFCDGWRH